MAVPKKKTSQSRRNMRRAHDKLDVPPMATCNNCGNFKSPHHVCFSCGYYGTKQIFVKNIPADDSAE